MEWRVDRGLGWRGPRSAHDAVRSGVTCQFCYGGHCWGQILLGARRARSGWFVSGCRESDMASDAQVRRGMLVVVRTDPVRQSRRAVVSWSGTVRSEGM